MESPSSSLVIIVGAGISGISAAKALAENGVEDLLILEAADRIGGRIRKEEFGGLNVETGAGWIQGVGGKEPNPVWELASKSGLRTCYSDYSNARFNIYDQSGKIFPSAVAADSYKRAVESAIRELRNQEANLDGISSILEPPMVPKTPIELAIDFILHDFEMAEVEPIATYTDLGEREFLVADERGYEHLLYKMAESFLRSSQGEIVDSRLKVNKKWKTEAISKLDVIVYTKIFLKFPYKFWPCGPGTEFFLYAHEKRGYYTFWQHMENAYPGSNILVVTLTNEESKRVELQSEEETLREAMGALRDMFGPQVPDACDILVPKWWNNRFQRCSYSNYPMLASQLDFRGVKAPVGPIFFTGEHTHERFNGYVHGGYLSGIDTSKSLLEAMMMREEDENEEDEEEEEEQEGSMKERRGLERPFLLEPLLALTETLTQQGAVSRLQKWDSARQLYFRGKLSIIQQQQAIK